MNAIDLFSSICVLRKITLLDPKIIKVVLKRFLRQHLKLTFVNVRFESNYICKFHLVELPFACTYKL